MMEWIAEDGEFKSSYVIYKKGLISELHFVNTLSKPMYYSIYDVSNKDTIKYGENVYIFQKYGYNILDLKDYKSLKKFFSCQLRK